MPQRITKFGIEVLGKPYPATIPSPPVSVVFPLISESNWRGEFTDETVWQTEVGRSKTKLAEEREARVSRPGLNFSALISGLSRIETGRLLSNAFQICTQPTAMPIYSDITILISISGGTQYFCDTSYRRLYPGQRVGVVPANYSLISNDTQMQVGRIASVDSSSITLELSLSVTPNPGDLIVPLVDCEVSLSQEIQALTDGVTEWQQIYSQISGSNSLPPFSGTDLGRAAPTYGGYPIWDMSYNWRENVRVSVIREGVLDPSGNTVVASVDGEKPVLGFSGTYELYERADIWKASKFFDSRRGRLRPFWAVSPIMLFENATVVDSLTITATLFTTPFHLESFITTVAAILPDGSISIHEVESIDHSGSVLTINLTSFTPIDLDATEITTANLCRFDQDNLKRTWLSDGVCVFELAHRSLLEEEEFLLL